MYFFQRTWTDHFLTFSAPGDGANGVIVGAIVAAAALLVVVPATALNLWRRKTQQDHFFDVAGWSIRRHVSSMCGISRFYVTLI